MSLGLGAVVFLVLRLQSIAGWLWLEFQHAETVSAIDSAAV